jgi:hypothetical protein
VLGSGSVANTFSSKNWCSGRGALTRTHTSRIAPALAAVMLVRGRSVAQRAHRERQTPAHRRPRRRRRRRSPMACANAWHDVAQCQSQTGSRIRRRRRRRRCLRSHRRRRRPSSSSSFVVARSPPLLGAPHFRRLLLVAPSPLRRLEALRHVAIAFLRLLRYVSLRLPVLLRVRRSCNIVQYASQKVCRVVVQCHRLTFRCCVCVGTKNERFFFFFFCFPGRHATRSADAFIRFSLAASLPLALALAFAPFLPPRAPASPRSRLRSRRLDNGRCQWHRDRSLLPMGIPDSPINRSP